MIRDDPGSIFLDDLEFVREAIEISDVSLKEEGVSNEVLCV